MYSLRVAKPLACLCLLIPLAGCSGSSTSSESGDASDQFTDANVPTLEELKPQLDEVLEFTQQRHLDTATNAGWQIMHGLLAFRDECVVRHRGKLIRALPMVLAGEMRGWNMRPTEHGVENWIQGGSAIGPGHADQWIAVLAQCDVAYDQIFYLDEKREKAYQLGDIIDYALWSTDDNKECSWTVIAISQYLPRDPSQPHGRGKLADIKWMSKDGTEWDVERIVNLEASQDLAISACGGSHRLTGLSRILQRHLSEGGELTGPWLAAHQKIENAAAAARRFQSPDGSFSINYFQRQGKSPDAAKLINTSGHTLEMLATSLPAEQLQEPWLRKAVARMCELFELTKEMNVESGALYHAANGLRIYRHKVFGPLEPFIGPESSIEEFTIASSAPAAASDAEGLAPPQ